MFNTSVSGAVGAVMMCVQFGARVTAQRERPYRQAFDTAPVHQQALTG